MAERSSHFMKRMQDNVVAPLCEWIPMQKIQGQENSIKMLGYEEVGIVPCVFNGIPNVQLVCLEKDIR